ncbi:MAG: phosphoglucomutase/phosphomannomutase family protein [Candidatus Omnitrophota bacterium]
MHTIKFGTDGWRGVIAEDFTFANVRKVAQAIAEYLKPTCLPAGRQPAAVIVGYDRRFLSEEYAKAICEVLAGNGLKTLFAGKPTPTPAITLAIKQRGLSGGIVVTASHNPAKFNGIKFKTKDAMPADEQITKQLEELIGKSEPKLLDFNTAKDSNLIEIENVDNAYVDFVKKYIKLDLISRQKPDLLVDYMHGAGAGYVEKILSETGCSVRAIRDELNPLFGGVSPEPVPRNLQVFLKTAKKLKPKLGIALDGDADRIAACGADGVYLSSGQIISLILLHLLEHSNLRGTVVKTISGTNLINKIADDYKLKLLEMRIGFKHISKVMLTEDVLIGGEESGGIGFKGYIPERDGIVSGLFLLKMVAARNKSIDKIMKDVNKKYGVFYYDRLDLHIPVKNGDELISALKKSAPGKIFGKDILKIKTYDGIKYILKDESWLLIRPSGTEPVIRIYAETPKRSDLKNLLNAGKRLAIKWN